MVEAPEEYEWSSYNVYLGKDKDEIVECDKILSYFKQVDCRVSYKAYVESAILQEISESKEEGHEAQQRSQTPVINCSFCN